jgi:Ribbon-helix-helix protein, copG family
MSDAEKTAQDRERITVVLLPKAAAGLAALRERTGLSKTDLVNRAISLYGLIDGNTPLIQAPDGTGQQVMFL